MEKSNHLFAKDISAACENFDFKIGVHDLLIDLKVLMKEYYIATFTENENVLKISFTNGQAFKIIIEQIR